MNCFIRKSMLLDSKHLRSRVFREKNLGEPWKLKRGTHAQAYAGALTFENEHMLSTKPMQMDVMVIKKEPQTSIQKNIGRIFRTYNIIEYKSPDDHLNIDDFYKVYGYGCFYKSDTATVDQILIRELTLTFVCYHYPRKVIRHLEETRGCLTEKQEAGIYYVTGELIPIQIIVVPELTDEKKLWLHSMCQA